MRPDAFAAADEILSRAVSAPAQRPTVPAAQLVVRRGGEQVFARAYGWLDPAERAQPTTGQTLFDLASITKLFTTTLFMLLAEAGQTALDQPVCAVLPEFSGPRPIQPYEDPLNWSATVDASGGAGGTVDAAAITFRQLLTHTAGLPAWRPLLNAPNPAAAQAMALTTFFAYPPNTRVIYSDIGLILLGLAVERLGGLPLAQAVQQRICRPLGLAHTTFLPIHDPTQEKAAPPAAAAGDPESSASAGLSASAGFTASAASPASAAPTEFCTWRGRRVRGEVHDENAWRLGGAAGHAGLFSTAHDLAALGQMYLDGGHPLLRAATVQEMVREQAREGATRRGIGFHLWSPDPEASSHPFSPLAFGHTGFTGTCLWIDPRRELVVALLTNEVYNGRADRAIGPLRVAVHQAVVAASETPGGSR